MMLIRSAYLLLALTVLAGPDLHADQLYPATTAALDEELLSLPWEFEPISYRLTESSSTFRLPEGLLLLRDAAARRLLFLTQGTEFLEAEAYVLDPVNETQVILSYIAAGYVTLDDWETLDRDTVLRIIKETTDEGNRERQTHGIPPLRIKGWLEDPVLHRESATAYWSVMIGQDLADGGPHDVVNAVALKLGRYGFQRLTWVGTLEQYLGGEASLAAIVDAHSYATGTRYADYSIGDQLSGFGIASLVAVAAGGQSKTGKSILAVIIATLVVFVKKFIFLPIMLAAAAIWGLLTKAKRKLTGG